MYILKFFIRIFIITIIIIIILPAVMLWQLRFINPIHSSQTPIDFNLDYISEEFVTIDNIILSGWLIPKLDADEESIKDYPTLVFLHGWPADKGDILPIFVSLAEDYNLFFFDFRGLGKSQGKYSTIGVKETKDLTASLDFLQTEYDINEVGLWGFSMGGAVALRGAAEDDRIRAVVSDSSYAALSNMNKMIYRIPLIHNLLGRITSFYAYLFLDLNINEARPIDIVDNIDIPTFLIHSPSDKAIPFSEAEYLIEAFTDYDNLQTWFPEGGHNFMTKDYSKRIKAFFDKVF